jgi:glycosyltransferase involved in cell wall biosynthesis
LQDHILYLGFVPLAQMVQELEAADVGIVAQKASPYSHLVHTGKMYDYLEFEKPVIASRLRATRAYFDEESLQFFEPGDADDLAQAILDLYNHPKRRASLIGRSKRLFELYNWNKQRENYLKVYYQLTGIPQS